MPQISENFSVEKIEALPFDQQFDTAWIRARMAYELSGFPLPTLVLKKDNLAVAIFFEGDYDKERYYEGFKRFPLNPVDHFLFICEAYALEMSGALDDIIGQALPSQNPRSRESLLIYGETRSGQKRTACIPTDGKGPIKGMEGI